MHRMPSVGGREGVHAPGERTHRAGHPASGRPATCRGGSVCKHLAFKSPRTCLFQRKYCIIYFLAQHETKEPQKHVKHLARVRAEGRASRRRGGTQWQSRRGLTSRVAGVLFQASTSRQESARGVPTEGVVTASARTPASGVAHVGARGVSRERAASTVRSEVEQAVERGETLYWKVCHTWYWVLRTITGVWAFALPCRQGR